jgi:hypothetical protein
MRVAEKHQIGVTGKIRVSHHAAILSDHGERSAADSRRTGVSSPRQEEISRAGNAGEANCEGENNIEELAGSLLPGNFLGHFAHGAQFNQNEQATPAPVKVLCLTAP